MPTAATDVWLNSGPGQRLDGQSTASNGPGSSAGAYGADSGFEDQQMAMAISASMREGKEEGGGSVGEDDESDEDEVARAIALSLEQDTPGPGVSLVHVGRCV